MDPIPATIFGFSFIFLMTSLGAAIVFFFRGTINEAVRSAIFGFAGGIMVSASFWGLLLPALEEAEEEKHNYPDWLPLVIGFVLGCLFLFSLDLTVPLCIKQEEGQAVDVNTLTSGANELGSGMSELPLLSASQKGEQNEDSPERKLRLARAFKLFLAITIHNIPEGVACGLSFGHALKQEGEEKKKAIATAVGLSIGIGIQDIPEGAAVSLPIWEISGSVMRGFVYGVLSGLVEPIGATAALGISTFLKAIDPWALAFSGGAMIYVTIEELVPEAMGGEHPLVSIWMFVLGFVLMMVGEQIF
jgi:ZIP family zinc transporter